MGKKAFPIFCILFSVEVVGEGNEGDGEVKWNEKKVKEWVANAAAAMVHTFVKVKASWDSR